nr:diguanylate cyclase [Calidifontimicrobium sp. SYSU G02091]
MAVDIDHVKQVNDRHGHLAGDALLTLVAQRLLATAREADTVAGVGGEEFVILRAQTTAAGATAGTLGARCRARGLPSTCLLPLSQENQGLKSASAAFWHQ